MPATAILNISASDTGPKPTWGQAEWNLSIQVHLTKELSSPTIPLKMRNEGILEHGRDIRWLMEEHATKDSFDTSRAEKARSALTAFAEQLGRSIAEAVLPRYLPKKGNTMLIRIHHSKNSDVIHCLPWEALAYVAAWPLEISYRDFYVERVVVDPDTTTVSETTDLSDGKLHLLVLCSRPEGPGETPAELISAIIAKVVSVYPRVKEAVDMHMVRPGTWDALVKALESKPKGYYKMVHIDMHGQVEGGSYSLNFLKKSARGRIRRAKIDADKVAELLVKHGTQFATMNACESAFTSTDGGPDSRGNFARVLIDHGMKAVVATSFRAMDSTMELFYCRFFEEFLTAESSFQSAVVAGRNVLLDSAAMEGRKARFGRTVRLDDYIVPLVYSRSDVDTRTISFYRPELNPFLGYDRKRATNPTMIGRIQDVLKIETLLGICPILLLHGYGGVGKSTLVRHLEWWWEATGFVETVVHIDIQHFDNNWTVKDVLGGIERDIAAKRLSTKAEDSTSLLVVVDGVEQWMRRLAVFHGGSSEASKSHEEIRQFFEKMVEKNDDAEPAKNTYVVLTSRTPQAFGWDLSSDIVSHYLSGLSIVHGLELGWKKAMPLFSANNKARLLEKELDSEERDNLEKVIEVLDGNPLAIELAFEGFARSGLPITKMLETVLSGHISLKVDTTNWKADQPGPRYFTDVQTIFYLWMLDLKDPNHQYILPQCILGLFNLVAPGNMLVYLYLYRRLLLPEQVQRSWPDMDGLTMNPANIDMVKKALAENGAEAILKSLLARAEKEGWIVPLDTEKLLDGPPEFYYIHPVFTLVLRDIFNTAPQFIKEAKTAFVQYRIMWDMLFAMHLTTSRTIPRHEWTDRTKRSFETCGKWNMVAALMHAQQLAEGTKITRGPLPWSVRLLIPIGPALRSFKELISLLRPSLLKELMRHLESTEHMMEDETSLYSALKLAYYLRYSGRATVWEQINKAHKVAEDYMASGKTLSGPSQLALMETRHVEANRFVGGSRSHELHALKLLERNLRFQPQVKPDYPDLPSMKRAIKDSLLLWAGLSAKLDKGKKNEGENPPSDGGEVEPVRDEEGESFADSMVASLTKSLVTDEEARKAVLENQPMRQFFFFRNADPEKMASFSEFTRSILDAPSRDVISDLAPDEASMKAFMQRNLQDLLKSKNLDIELAEIRISHGNKAKAKETLHQTLEKQLRDTNDAATNYYIHVSLAQIAVDEKKWSTAIEHYTAMIKLGTEGTSCYSWLEICKCYDKMNDIEGLRKNALKAVSEARKFQQESETNKDRMLLDTFKTLTELPHIKDFSCIAPKRKSTDEDDTRLDDSINPALMYKKLLFIVHRPEQYDAYTHDGVLFARLWNTARLFAGQFVTNPNATSLVLPRSVSPEMRSLCSGILLLESELMQREPVPGIRMEDIGKEAEDLIFQPQKAKLRALHGTRWAASIGPVFLTDY